MTVLAKDLPSPLAPESDEEKAAGRRDEKKPDEKTKTRHKKENARPASISRTSVSAFWPFPIPARNYVSMSAGKTGVLFLVEAPLPSIR